MDAIHPRLLVSRYRECFGFYAGVLRDVAGATLARGDADSHYASWDIGGEGVLALVDRAVMAEIAALARPEAEKPREPSPAALSSIAFSPAASMLVLRVDDVEEALALAQRHGGRVAAPVRERPGWGPTMRTAHLLDPEGNLLEFQSY